MAVALLAFVIRWLVISDTHELALIRSPQLDSFEFLTWANEIRQGEYAWPSPPTHGPLYPYALAAFLQLSGGSLYGARLCQAALGGVSVLLAIQLALRFFQPAAALAAGVILALYGPLVYVETALYEEGTFIFLLLLSLLLFDPTSASPGRRIAVGLCVGGAAAARPTALVLLPLFVWLEIRASGRFQTRWRRSALIAASCAIALAPVLVKNYQASGTVFIRAFGGLNVYMGNRPGSDGTAEARVGERWDLLQAEPISLGITHPAEQDRYYVARTVRETWDQPGAWLQVLGRKLLWLVQRTEIRESHSFRFVAEQSRWLGLLPGFALLFPFAAAGVWVALRTGAPALPLLVGYLALFALTCLGLVVSLRYRLPLVPVLAIFSGVGLGALWSAVRDRHWPRVTKHLLVICTALALTVARPHTASLNFAEEWAFTGDALLAERNLPEAKAAYQRSIDLDPRRALGWDGMGMIAVNQGRWEEAERAFREALAREPDWSMARHHLGLALIEQGRREEGVAELRRARSLRPDDSAITSDLANTLVTIGEVDEALALYRELEQRARPDPRLYVAIARAEGLRGRLDEARIAVERAVALDPADGEAWFLLSTVRRASRQLGEAEAALERATSLLGSEVVEVQLAWAMLRHAQGRPVEAEALVRHVLERAPESPQARQLLLRYAAEGGRREVADEFLRRLDARKP